MGCAFAHPRRRADAVPHLFKVLNMDKDGRERNSGKIEITDSELVFHQKEKEAIRWPLRSLRRYGFDAELFSFESGRRCPTGPGIYAFKCSRAEALFNLLQECIQRAGQQDDQSPRPGGVVIDATQRPMSVADLHPAGDNNLRNSANVPHMLNHNGGPTSHANGVVALQAFPQISNSGHEYVNSDTLQNGLTADTISASNVPIDLSRQVSLQSEPEAQIQYAELDLGQVGVVFSPSSQGVSIGDSSHANYMNLPTGMDKSVPSLSSSVPLIDAPLPPVLEEEDIASDGHTANYLNLGINAPSAQPNSKPKIMYIEIDFKNSEQDGAGSSGLANGHAHTDRSSEVPLAAQSTPTTESYAVIDFHKTAAINNINNSNHREDEGARKTRHNSSIDF